MTGAERTYRAFCAHAALVEAATSDLPAERRDEPRGAGARGHADHPAVRVWSLVRHLWSGDKGRVPLPRVQRLQASEPGRQPRNRWEPAWRCLGSRAGATSGSQRWRFGAHHEDRCASTGDRQDATHWSARRDGVHSSAGVIPCQRLHPTKKRIAADLHRRHGRRGRSTRRSSSGAPAMDNDVWLRAVRDTPRSTLDGGSRTWKENQW